MAGLLSVPAEGREAVLKATLARWASEPFDARRANCALSVLAYVEQLSGVVPLEHLRDISKFDDDQAFASYCGGVMRGLGWQLAKQADRGDVGLVDFGIGLTACICVVGWPLGAQRWAARGERGVVIQRADAYLVWRLPCPRR